MPTNSLFQKTRLRLAFWYAGVMGLLLSASGWVVYEVVSYIRWQVIDTELESIAGILHDGLEPYLKQSSQIAPEIQSLLPGVCLAGELCMQHTNQPGPQVLGRLHNEGYYARFLDKSGRVVATLGLLPGQTSDQARDKTSLQLAIDTSLINCSHGCLEKRTWQILNVDETLRYRQVSLLLTTSTTETWGYLQLGKSLEEFDWFIFRLRLIFLLGLPLAVVMIAGAAWWMAGLAMRPVYQSYQQIQQFTADAAHELRTPLAAIRATVEANLRNDQLTLEQACATLQTIHRQNHRLSQLVQDLLLLSRLDLRVITLQHAECCLNDLISDLLEEFFPLAIAANIKLATDVPGDHPLVVLGNEEQLYRLLANLVTNAIHYTPAHGEVRVRLERNEGYAIIQVQDTGIGISIPDQAHIFDRFYRVTSDRSRETGGSGLGLAIAQAIAKSHQGDIKVQSELGKGSTFIVRLPLKSNTNRLSIESKGIDT
ncbi:two-component system sensor histidine kinase RppB [Pantanalinema sp. GBBB05]|uniref:two-component system sensor histidine kinase RppB n=1 Tax=Pantanalinema sp. GBBB05 TaxID=2604139 RepID=UPI001DD1727E|nr:HAMP domain-containing histidine kinase [Pantanalinema sp. GBBB05]